MNVKISIDAEHDIEEGFWFYEKQSLGLGDYFRNCVVNDIDSLATFAGIHERSHGYSRLLVKRFPYIVYYDVADDTATVVAVLDARRDPSWTKRRLS